MDRIIIFVLLLLLPLVLALLTGGLEVFNLLGNVQSRQRAEEYEEMVKLRGLEEAVTLERATMLSAAVNQLLMDSASLQNELEESGSSNGKAVSEVRQQLRNLLLTLNGMLDIGDSRSKTTDASKTLIPESCTKNTATCSPTELTNTTLNLTFTECVTPGLSFEDGEVLGGTMTRLLVGKVVHRDCIIDDGGRTGNGPSAIDSIPSVGTSLVFNEMTQRWYCRCYGISNGTAPLQSFNCRLTTTVCNERGTIFQ